MKKLKKSFGIKLRPGWRQGDPFSADFFRRRMDKIVNQYEQSVLTQFPEIRRNLTLHYQHLFSGDLNWETVPGT